MRVAVDNMKISQIADYKEQVPPVPTREARLEVERNRMFVGMVIALAIALFSIWLAIIAFNRPTELQVVHAKMYRDGNWDIEVYDPKKPVEYFESTINNNISEFVKRRFQEIPYSISADYGYVLEIMAPPLKQEFTAENGFNAADRAARIKGCTGCGTKDVKIRNIAHFESDRTQFGSTSGTLYKTNVFVEIIEKDYQGNVTGKPQRMIVPLEWRLKTKAEIIEDLKRKSNGDDLANFYHNPIGFEVLRYDIMSDGSQ